MSSKLVAMTVLVLATGAFVVRQSPVEVSPPPPESRYQSPFPPPLNSFVEMSQPDAERYIVAGVDSLVGESARRAGPVVTLRFLAPPNLPVKFFASFSLSQTLMKKAGPLLLQISIDGKLFDEVSYDQPGDYYIEKAVPQGQLRWDAETEVSVELILAEHRALADHDLSFLISAVGFRLPPATIDSESDG